MLYLCTRILVLSKFVDLLSASAEYVHISGQFFSLPPSLSYINIIYIINIIYPLNTFTIYNIFTLTRGVVSSSFKTRLINVYLYH